MRRLKTFLVGILIVLWQLGCGGTSKVGSPQGGPFPNTQPNISLSPATAVMGSADLTLTITGSQAFPFVNAAHKQSEVIWSVNGTDTRLNTTFVSSLMLTATVPASLLVSPLDANVRVEIWDLQGDAPDATSSRVSFRVDAAPPATPSISSISPVKTQAGGSDLTITISGANFENYLTVAFWATNPNNLHDTGKMLATSFVSSSQVTAVIPAALLQTPGSVQIVVLTGDPMGMSDGYFGYPKSNSVTFTVTP